jgi:hypothetical protein
MPYCAAVDGADHRTVEAVAGVLAGWGVEAHAVDGGLLLGPEGVSGLVTWLGTELERRNEMMELAERVRSVLLEVVEGGLGSRHLDELEAVMMRYALAAEEDKERFGLGNLLDLFERPPEH